MSTCVSVFRSGTQTTPKITEERFINDFRSTVSCERVPAKLGMQELLPTHRASFSMLAVNGREEDTTTTSRPVITIYPTISTESIVIPIVSCIVVVPLFIATFILLLRQGNHCSIDLDSEWFTQDTGYKEDDVKNSRDIVVVGCLKCMY